MKTRNQTKQHIKSAHRNKNQPVKLHPWTLEILQKERAWADVRMAANNFCIAVKQVLEALRDFEEEDRALDKRREGMLQHQ
jgi:hypothetical protein